MRHILYLDTNIPFEASVKPRTVTSGGRLMTKQPLEIDSELYFSVMSAIKVECGHHNLLLFY